MGKARIVSGGTAGEYQVEVLHFRERLDREIASLTVRAAKAEADLAEVNERLEMAELEVEEAYIAVNGLILQLVEGDGMIPPEMEALITAHNIERAREGVPPLKGATALHKAAQDHASWLRSNNKVGHTGEGGSDQLDRIKAAGYPISPGGFGSENMAAGMSGVDNVMQAWMWSSGHRRNLLRPDWEHIGVGYARRTDGPYKHFWVVTFGRPGTGQSAQLGGPLPPDLLDMGESMVPLESALADAQIQLVEMAMQRDKIKLEQTTLLARELEVSRRLKALQAVPDDPIQQAWCADRTTNLTGTVATAEIPDEGNKRVILLPGYSGNTHSPPEHGQLAHRAGMTGPQAYFLAAILPGWQRWMPIHRVGTLTEIDYPANTGTVALDPEASSARGLPVNRVDRLENVPIVYMTCNAQAFEVNDRVLVEFVGQRVSSPRVIGFESRPRQCINWPRVDMFVFPSFESIFPDGYDTHYNESNLVSPTTFECCIERSLPPDNQCIQTRNVVCHGSAWVSIGSSAKIITWRARATALFSGYHIMLSPDDPNPVSTLDFSWREPELQSYETIRAWQLDPLPSDHTFGWAPDGSRLMGSKSLVELLFSHQNQLTIARRSYSRTWAYPDGYYNCATTQPPCDNYEDQPMQQTFEQRAAGLPTPKWGTQPADVDFHSTDLGEIYEYLMAQEVFPKVLWVAYIPNPLTGVVVDVSEYRPTGCDFTDATGAVYIRYRSVRMPA